MQKLRVDMMFLIVIMCIVGYGISMNYSASSALSLRTTGTLNTFLYQHLIFVAFGFMVMIVVAKIKYEWFRRTIWWINGVTILLLLLTYLPAFRVSVNGADRWIDLFGITFQPSEMAKITVILTLSHLVDNARKKGTLNQWRNRKEGLLPILMYIALYLAIVLLQKHLSATVIIGAISVTILFIGGVKKRYLFFLGGSGLILGVIGVMMQSYRVERILNFRDPAKNALDGGFQIIQSWYALGSGEWFGLGLGMSRQKFWIPENHTDFIIAVIGEELGLVGVFLVIVFFIFFLFLGLIIAAKGKNIFEQTMVAGIILLIFYQFMINLSVVSGLMPVTGMPLPFISYGGTSLVVLFIGIGLIFNVTSRIESIKQRGDSTSRDPIKED